LIESDQFIEFDRLIEGDQSIATGQSKLVKKRRAVSGPAAMLQNEDG
jgi:hypothetical protein